MKTVLMAIAIIKDGDKLLIRKMDPAKNPYKEEWGLFGGRIDGEGMVEELLNKELKERWDMSVSIDERLDWDEDMKADHDGEVKRFVYIDALCSIKSGSVSPVNRNEELKWVPQAELREYAVNPPTATVFKKLNYI